MEINLNDNVLVKLNDHGRKLLKKDYDEFYKEYPKASALMPFELPAQDAEGWSSFQLWELFEMFGKHINHGSPIPFECGIRLTDPEDI